MNFEGFSPKDFDVFEIDGLEQRMEAIKERIRPKLEWLGSYFAPPLSAWTGEELFFHIAKHARRTVNPPKDTWVAWSNNKRGYKMAPHFQLGLWQTHLFVWFAIIYEAPAKKSFAEKVLNHINDVTRMIPDEFVWSWDHTKPEAHPHSLLKKEGLEKALLRVRDTKKAEMLCGITIDRDDPLVQDGQALIHRLEDVFKILAPLYRLL